MQAAELRRLGKQLASKKTWWGWNPDDEVAERSLISCIPNSESQWDVRVRDSIGVVAVPGKQITVSPKISSRHLLYLLGESGSLPSVVSLK
jgi:hypothetical protein